MSKQMEITIHRIAKVFPEFSDDAMALLIEDIKTNGLNMPIVYVETEDGKAAIVDGRNRYKAIKKLGVDPWGSKTITGQAAMRSITVPKGEDEDLFLATTARSLNMNRRHLTPSQMAAAAAELAEIIKKREAAVAKAMTAAEKEKEKEKQAKDREKAIAKGETGNTTRAKAAQATGASPRATGDAMTIKKESPELFQKVQAGDMTINEAMRELKAKKQRKDYDEAASAAPTEASGLYVVQAIDMLNGVVERPGPYDLIFADPPYNIGIGYKGYKDSVPEEEFASRLKKWVTALSKVLAPKGSLFLLVPDSLAASTDMIARGMGLHRRSWIIWYESFGQYLNGNFGRCHRHLLYYVANPKSFVFNEHLHRKQSERQKMGDKRANPDGKVLEDVWFDIPRLVQNSKERIAEFPTQLPVDLPRRCIEICSLPGGTVLDPFCGSGTTGEAALTADGGPRQFVGFDVSPTYVEIADKRLAAVAASILKKSGKDKK